MSGQSEGPCAVQGAVVPAFFRRTPEPNVFLPLGQVLSSWSADQLTGPAITGLLTLGAIERVNEVSPGRTLVRAAYELHSVGKLCETHVRSHVVKSGSRTTLVDVALEQGGREVARAHLYFAPPLEQPVTELWSCGEVPIPLPAPGRASDPHGRQYYSAETGWTAEGALIPGAARKAVWVSGVELVVGERTSNAALAGFAADSVSPVVNWGTAGIRHINIDATISLSREPVGEGVGLYATHVSVGEGVVVGSATVFDRQGALGVATVTSVGDRKRVNTDQWAPVM